MAKVKITKPPKDNAIAVVDLGKFSYDAMQRYGTYVNELRALPSLQDGFKPVSRKSVFVTGDIAKRPTKVSRVMGDVMGKYHPHGDAGIDDAIVTQGVASTPPIHGRGGWGTLTSGAAAHRYREMNISRYGEQFLQPDYLAITPTVPTYDNSGREPIFLPALLPNILINGGVGIGLGVASSVPSFTPASVIEVAIRLMEGEDLSGKEMRKLLKWSLTWGGKPTDTKENRSAINALMSKTASASIQFDSDLVIDEKARTITLLGAAPGVSIPAFEKKVSALHVVRSVRNEQAGVSRTIRVSRNTTPKEWDALVGKVRAFARGRQSFSIYVSKRTPLPEEDNFKTTFHRYTIRELLEAWIQFRRVLEFKCTEFRIARIDEVIHRLKLMVMVAADLKKSFKILETALKAKEPEPIVMKGFKVSLADAKIILELRLRQLSRLDQEALKKRLADLERQRSYLKKVLKNVDVSIIAYLRECQKSFTLTTPKDEFPLFDRQWILRLPKSANASVNDALHFDSAESEKD